MTVLGFYHRAASIPLILPVLGAAVLLLVGDGQRATQIPRFVLDVAAALAIGGALSALPYLVYLFVVLRVLKLRSRRQLRRAAWLAPLAIGIPFGLVYGAAALSTRGWAAAAPIGAFWGGMAFLVGTFYAVLIDALLHVLERRGWVQTA